MKVGIVVGRFQPLHNGHIKLIQSAMQACETVEIRIGVNRDQTDRTTRNPLFHFEVWTMLENYFDVEIAEQKVTIDTIYDVPGNDAEWLLNLLQPLEEWYEGEEIEYHLYCHTKDYSSYLDIFNLHMPGARQWEVHEVNTGSVNMVNATNIRCLFLEHNFALPEIFGLPYLSMHWLDKIRNEKLKREGVPNESSI
jgi:bifunctional NMN adenylyltransferase/nudix hydrolase